MTEAIVPRRPVLVRTGTSDDLPALEWFGLFTAHRAILRATIEAQARGTQLVLVAVAHDFPIGQVFVDLVRQRLWALRVFPSSRRRGIGAELVRRAERALSARNAAFAEIGAEKGNAAARRLYERLGYRLHRDECEHFTYITPWGDNVSAVSDQWILRKALSTSPA